MGSVETPPRLSPTFCFLSNMLRRRLRTSDGRVLGTLSDFAATLSERYPEIEWVVISAPSGRMSLPATAAVMDALVSGASVIPDTGLEPLALRSHQFLVKEMLLDKQVVDVQGAKVVRVNDVQFLYHWDKLHIVHVDVGLPGLSRRLGLETAVRRMAAVLRMKPKEELISWKFVQPLNEAGTGPVRISLRHEQIRLLHPGELADIIEELDPEERLALVRSIDTAQVADAIEEIDESVQAALIRDLDSELAADILEEMEPAAAVDVVEMLPQETQDSIMAAMEDDEREQIEILSRAEDDTAATVMTVEFVTIPLSLTASEALDQVREKAEEVEFITYVYCLGDGGKLAGVVSLRDLITSDGSTPVSALMKTRVSTVRPGDKLEDLADAFLKFRFLALPVVEETGHLEGLVTFQHSFDELLPFYGKAAG
jgi:CBS domain-containing protein/sporulation protein YlmC with PRC-barrel domain